MAPDPTLVARLAQHGQEGLLRCWADLDEPARVQLVSQIESIDLARLDELVKTLVHETETAALSPDRVGPVEVHAFPQTDGERASRRHVAEAGHDALSRGEVAVVLVAGGSGTRLGFDGPKGTFPIGPVSGASLFQIHAEKIVALGRRFGRPIPLYVMTSPENNEATRRFFDEHDQFGLDHLRLFVQGQMPAVGRETGRILLASKGQIALSPDGHGGTVAALGAEASDGGSSCLQEMKARGIKTLFYFQVDNPLVEIADPAFLGLHLQAKAEMSFKVIEKVAPDEKVGVVVAIDGVPQVIEYSDLAPELAERREPDGRLQLWAGSIAIHLFELDFLERLASGEIRLPFHRAVKKVPFVGIDGQLVRPEAPNAVKFEQFIFDALPLAMRSTLVETERSLEFEPLKNATGPDSPATVRQRMSDNFADWLEAAGAKVARRPDGSVPFGIEISPLFALDAGELKARLTERREIDGPVYLR
jgi:UDP-N-acetylglucosamine/UDP-N-acetylgalactosamine diphosphorylase